MSALVSRLFLYILCLVNLSVLYATPSETSDPGTLIVTYQTGEEGERLDRIRFWITNENNEQQMYPKENFVADESCQMRMVVVEDLNPGNYRVEFIIPNTDSLFEDSPHKDVSIIPGSIVKIDHTFVPRYASLTASINLPDKVDKFPTISLLNNTGVIVDKSNDGQLSFNRLIPGSYTLTFGDLEGYSTPKPFRIESGPNDILGPYVGNYFNNNITNTPDNSISTIASDPHKNLGPQVAYTVRSDQSTMRNNPIQETALMNVKTNISTARWVLYRKDIKIFSNTGSSPNLKIVANDYYSIAAEEIEGYTLRVIPSEFFTIHPGENLTVHIIYHRSYGFVDINALIPEGEVLSGTIQQQGGQEGINFQISSQNGKALWQSKPIPTGDYVVIYRNNEKYLPISPEKIHVYEGHHLLLNPELIKPRSLHVKANIDEATYVLRSEDNSKVWNGGGRDYTFENIPPGIYTLSFSSGNNETYAAPADIDVNVTLQQDIDLVSTYRIAGKLIIHTNNDQGIVTIDSLDNMEKPFKKQFTGPDKTIYLQEGSYKLSFDSNDLSQQPPKSIEVQINSSQPTEINVMYQTSPSQTRTKQRNSFSQIILKTNNSNAEFNLQSENDSSFNQRGKGKNVTFSDLKPGKYTVKFNAINEYKTPNPLSLELNPGEIRTLNAIYDLELILLVVPEGPTIIGDPFKEGKEDEQPSPTVNISEFSIGKYPVTNAQYANWLNSALKDNKIVYIDDSFNKGKITDLNGYLLCLTTDKESSSQITTSRHNNNEISFQPLLGKDQFPVINVSWYGAEAFCKDNQYVLPTEAQWEKAAGMEISPSGAPLKKFRYGFGQDTIDRSWANYKINDLPLQYFQVLTNQVGFYNGINLLPLTENDLNQMHTHNARSPIGAYDMSGNVWEWTSNWYSANMQNQNNVANDPLGPNTGTEKIAKGGCYDSLAEGVRVSERMPLPPEHLDAYTGFRIAK